MESASPIKIINSIAPMRICDNGGWTDTWFAGHGRVFSIAVEPPAQVQMKVFRRDNETPRVLIDAENYGQRYTIDPLRGSYDKHPLLEAAITYMGVPEDLRIEVGIYSEVPGGCSTGTSAAISVALIGALDCLTPGRLDPYQVAMAAHQIETGLLHQECGVQDQLASAFGGINMIHVHDFPNASVSPLHINDDLWWELESRLALVYVGQAHHSSVTHKLVIKELESEGAQSPRLETLRRTADLARDALCAGDLDALGQAFSANTRAQEELHPGLVGQHHKKIIEIAQDHGASGWKVNGAGGDGGSVSILAPACRAAKRAMIREIEQAGDFRHIPTRIARSGLRRWESSAREVHPTKRPARIQQTFTHPGPGT